MLWKRKVENCGETKFLINTDHHIDHVLGNAFLPGIVIAHEKTRQALMDAFPSDEEIGEFIDLLDPHGRMYMDGFSPRFPEITYSDTLSLYVGGLDIHLTHMPGHTSNNSLVYIEQQKIVFAGDLVCESGLPSFIDADFVQWLKAIEAIESMDIRYLVPGHGNICGKPEVKKFRLEMEQLLSEVRSRIDCGQSREDVIKAVAYEDNIHPLGLDAASGYSEKFVAETMAGSIARIYDQMLGAT